jgi:hypothetical protein
VASSDFPKAYSPSLQVQSKVYLKPIGSLQFQHETTRTYSIYYCPRILYTALVNFKESTSALVIESENRAKTGLNRTFSQILVRRTVFELVLSFVWYFGFVGFKINYLRGPVGSIHKSRYFS